MELIILTGMSGSGKSQVSKYLEDMGYFCIDNLPPQLMGQIVHSLLQGNAREGFGVEKLAFVTDVRSQGFFEGMRKGLADLDREGLSYRLLFMDSTNETLLSRYKQTRRMHPLAGKEGNIEGIRKERKQLEFLRREASDLIDTTNFSLNDLRDYIYKLLAPEDQESRMSILVESFGFKYGVPVDADLVFDVRFIPNPYYDPRLRVQTGLDPDVIEAVFSYPISQLFAEKQIELLLQLLPHYIQEGKVRLTIAVGCTGGRHRSVAMAEEFFRRLKSEGYPVRVFHRDQANDPRNITKIADYWKPEEGEDSTVPSKQKEKGELEPNHE